MSNQEVLNNNYRQPETVQLVPDALVYINGTNMLKDPDGKEVDIRQDITDISTSLNIDSVPGTANFTISYPEHSGGRFWGVSKYSGLVVMAEVNIYFRGRFTKEVEENGKKINKYPYYSAFWGVVTSIAENYTDGVHTISVSCADILRWWQITNTVINPSLISTQESLKSYLLKLKMDPNDITAFLNGKPIKVGGRETIITQTIFAGRTIPQILQSLCSVSMLQMIPISDYLDFNYGTSQVTSTLSDKISANQMDYWVERLNLIGTRLKIYGLAQNNKGTLNIDMSQLMTFPPGTNLDKLIGDPQTVYQETPVEPSLVKSDFKSQLEIANEIKEAIHYEFFMDVSGELVFKMPFYNLDVRENINSVIQDVDIINWNFIQSESEVVTRVDVSGELTNLGGGSLIVN